MLFRKKYDWDEIARFITRLENNGLSGEVHRLPIPSNYYGSLDYYQFSIPVKNRDRVYELLCDCGLKHTLISLDNGIGIHDIRRPYRWE